MSTRNLLITLIVAILVLVAIWLLFLRAAGPPALQTYSISGTITLVNECTGDGADNPSNTQIIVRLYYDGDPTPVTNVEQVAMALQADGVTTIGNYAVSDVHTNETGDRWEIDFPSGASPAPVLPRENLHFTMSGESTVGESRGQKARETE